MAAVKSVTYEGHTFSYAKVKREGHAPAFIFWELGSDTVHTASSEQAVFLMIGGLVAQQRGA